MAPVDAASLASQAFALALQELTRGRPSLVAHPQLPGAVAAGIMELVKSGCEDPMRLARYASLRAELLLKSGANGDLVMPKEIQVSKEVDYGEARALSVMYCTAYIGRAQAC